MPAGYEALNYPGAVGRFGRAAVEEQWLGVNNDAFSWHPEQGGWDAERLRRGMETDWFDPEGVLLFWSGSDVSGDGGPAPELAGFHWTKWHGDDGAGRKIGEVYVVGLADGFRGRGLGGPLISSGLHHLADRGADEVILYVEADNTAAVAAYERLGFGVRERHVAYGSPE